MGDSIRETCRNRVDSFLKTRFGWIPARIALGVIAWFGFVNLYMVRVNLSVAIIAMAKRNISGGRDAVCVAGLQETSNDASYLPSNDSKTSDSSSHIEYMEGEFSWDETTQGLILGAFFYGYVFSQGPSWPSMHACISRWIPPIERPRFIAIVYLAKHGWEAQFYVMGCLSLVWCCVWFSFMYDSPEEHPRISAEERDYIQTVLLESGTKKSTSKRVPWKDIFTSIPVWAIFVYTFGNGWGVGLYFSQLPTYMRNVLGFSIKSNGALSAVPFLCRYLGGILWSFLGSYLISHKYLSITNTRKAFAIIGLVGPALLLLGVSFSGCDAVAAVTLLCIALFCNGAGTTSGFVNHTDIAPNFAGTLLGFSNTLGSILGFVVPLVTGIITEGQQTLEAWQKVFWICVPIYIVPAIFVVIFMSGEVQPWNDVDSLNRKSSAEIQRLQENHGDVVSGNSKPALETQRQARGH